MKSNMITLQRRQLHQIMRHAFKAFLIGAFKEMHGAEIKWNWHHDVICNALLHCHMGEHRRLIINVPPRSLKSFICNVAWPAWLMGNDPGIEIISVSYAQDLSNKFSRDQRSLMSSEFYQNIFPKTKLNPKKQGEGEFETTTGGFRLSTSTGGVLTGRGADIIIIDDPLKPQDALSEVARNNAIKWIESTLMTRLNDKQHGKMVMVMQRLHEEDPAGHLLEKGGWKHLSFAAIALQDELWELGESKTHARLKGILLHPEHEPAGVLAELKRDLGAMHFNAQYQQQPIPIEGNIIKEEHFRYADRPHQHRGAHYISIDSAMKNGPEHDYCAITIWQRKEGKNYIVDLVRDKMSFPQLMQCIDDLRKRYAPTSLLIEDASSGTPLLQILKSRGINCTPCKPAGSKIERLSAASLAFERGAVFFPTNNPHWLKPLQHELLGFPNCKHDDQVDSVSQFLNWAMTAGAGRAYTTNLKGL
jgi:predicted phage terminase large subunit-like protein